MSLYDFSPLETYESHILNHYAEINPQGSITELSCVKVVWLELPLGAVKSP